MSAKRHSRKVREAFLGYALVLPSLLVFATFVFYPFAKNFWLGLYRTPLFPGLPREWAGTDQYREVLFGGDGFWIFSADFWNSLKVTVLFALFTVPAGIALGLALAVLAHQRLRGIAVYRTIFSSTVATSVAVASVIFFTLLNPRVGLIPYWFGTSESLLENPDWALVAVSASAVWQNLGLSFIIMSAGLQAVPDELLEAARVDGAGVWSRFRNVTLPLLSPTLFFAIVVGSILAFQAFGQIDLLTQGGPQDNTNVLVYAIYKESAGSTTPNEGKAAILAIALFAITMALTLVQLRFLERRVTYAR
ncbi:MAG: carbohydrate ABC transporter permease [Actinomycetota bacterium]